MTNPSLLEVRALTVRYGRALALSEVSVDAPVGAISAIVGPNGAGKSSLLGAIYGSVAASGRVSLAGSDVSALPALRRARAGMAYVPQGRQLFPHMTVYENIRVMAGLFGVPGGQIEAAMDRFPILRERRNQLAGVLSGGEQQMLVISRALMGEPKLLLLDEMVTGLAPRIVQELMGTVRELAERGVAVLMAEPSISAIKDQIDRGFVLIRGTVTSQAAGGDELERAYQAGMGLIVAAADATAGVNA